MIGKKEEVHRLMGIFYFYRRSGWIILCFSNMLGNAYLRDNYNPNNPNRDNTPGYSHLTLGQLGLDYMRR